MSGLGGTSAWSLFRERDFALFCGARFLSGTALQMQNVAVGWLVYDLTHSPLALGLAGLAAFLPAVLLALVTGHVADTIDRRLVMTASFAMCGVAALGLVACALVGETAVPAIYGLIALYGASRAFANPAGQALLPNLVPRPRFSQAITLASSTWQCSIIGGPALGGFLYVLGPQVVFGCAAFGFGAAALLSLSIGFRNADRPRERASWARLVEGIAFIRSRPILLGAISLDLFAVLLGGATALLPVYAQTILNTGPWGLGLLRSMPGAGALVMSVILATFPLERGAGLRMFAAVGVFGLATIGFGLSSSLPVSMLCLLVTGAADTVSVVVRQTLTQAETPDGMRGRVAAVNSLFIGASNELGEFESGVAASWLGTVPAVVLGGIGTVAIAIAWSWLFPALRRRDRLVRVEPA